MNPDTLKLTQTIPPPLFNRNPGYLCETLAEVAATEARYAVGDISLAETLPVRRDWAAVQLPCVESLRNVMQEWAEVAGYLKRP